MQPSIIDKIKGLTEEVIRWNELEKQVMLQRSKINWLAKGDGNNAFFHAYVKARHNAKCLQFLQKMMVLS